MGHHHHHHDSSNNIKVAFLLNISFTIVEIIGGLLINSMAILSDALHDLGDSFSLGLSWFLDKYSKKESNEKYSYGYRRYSLLAALINTMILIIGSFFILTEAIPRLLNPQYTNAKGMIVFAVIGVVVNGVAVLKVKGGKSLNEKVVSWHLLEDALGWIAVLIVAIIMYFTDLYILDPIISICLTLYILYNVINNFKKTISLFLQAVPEDIDILSIEKDLLEIKYVISTHHIHIWSLDSEHHVLTAHLVVEEDISKKDILEVKKKAKQVISDLNMKHVTIEIETPNEQCSLC